MIVMVLDQSDDIEILRALGEEWAASAHGIEFGLPIDINIGLATMRRLATDFDGDVLVLVDKEQIAGFIGLAYHPNHIGPGLIANECLFYISRWIRGGKGAMKLKGAARGLAKSKGCNFIIWNASKIAGDANHSGKLYEHDGAKLFESSYLEVL